MVFRSWQVKTIVFSTCGMKVMKLCRVGHTEILWKSDVGDLTWNVLPQKQRNEGWKEPG